ncbi:hypothetical protein BCR33DRAFT_314668 [Rhizoclosmatium globosum]|uniref:Uncharacterized protein n=1 Tax=Rhizoclosmatium globosum TaxID=329046 RepID=A0A1Y2CZB7_9FUNG|nr:hypothetical protein BCR33DRAFT_314668 [Rhizoclosmatium globosum]|eukprot:ORY52297.1 hypothetical protein BCR33DRAFT_314668 [Rhizoclosmatium globosum]
MRKMRLLPSTTSPLKANASRSSGADARLMRALQLVSFVTTLVTGLENAQKTENKVSMFVLESASSVVSLGTWLVSVDTTEETHTTAEAHHPAATTTTAAPQTVAATTVDTTVPHTHLAVAATTVTTTVAAAATTTTTAAHLPTTTVAEAVTVDTMTDQGKCSLLPPQNFFF